MPDGRRKRVREDEFVFFYPGLGDNLRLLKWIAQSWHHEFGYTTYVDVVPWLNNSEPLKRKIERVHDKISAAKQNGARKIILVGASAAGSFVFNVAFENSDVDKAANICGRLKDGGPKAWPSLQWAARKSPAFKESVQLFENRIPKLTDQQKSRLVTVGSWFDGIVPVETVPLPGVLNLKTKVPLHPFSIPAALTLRRNDLINFFDA